MFSKILLLLLILKRKINKLCPKIDKIYLKKIWLSYPRCIVSLFFKKCCVVVSCHTLYPCFIAQWTHNANTFSNPNAIKRFEDLPTIQDIEGEKGTQTSSLVSQNRNSALTEDRGIDKVFIGTFGTWERLSNRSYEVDSARRWRLLQGGLGFEIPTGSSVSWLMQLNLLGFWSQV